MSRLFIPNISNSAAAAVFATLLVLQFGCAAKATTKAPTRTNTVLRPAPAVTRDNTGAIENGNQARKAVPDTAVEQTKPAPQSNPVTESLRGQARSALDDGNLPQATRLLERALRIDPRDPATYYVFAQLRQQQQRNTAAGQLVDKALSLRPQDELKLQLLQLRSQLAE